MKSKQLCQVLVRNDQTHQFQSYFTFSEGGMISMISKRAILALPQEIVLSLYISRDCTIIFKPINSLEFK